MISRCRFCCSTFSIAASRSLNPFERNLRFVSVAAFGEEGAALITLRFS
jgi:hypothetical protein